MKKQLVIVGITLVLLVVGLSGCNEKSTDEEKILGTWLGETSGDEETSIFNFFSNGTYSIGHRLRIFQEVNAS